MSAAEFRAALSGLGLSQSGFARITGADPRTVRRWAAGAEIPAWVPLVLRLMAAAPQAWAA
jgi:DNA-binding transcriptional regulator YiaG